MYLLIEQEQPRVALYRRTLDGRWFIGGAHGLDTTRGLAIGGEAILGLRNIYERATFAPPQVRPGATIDAGGDLSGRGSNRRAWRVTKVAHPTKRR